MAVVRAEDARRITDGVRDAQLLVEVSVTSLHRDLLVKARIHAQAGIQEYCVVDVRNRQVVVHRDPGGEGYADVVEHGADDVLHACGVDVGLAESFQWIEDGG